MRHLLSTLAVAALGAACHAQLVFGSTTTANATTPSSGAFYLDLSKTTATRLWNGANSRKVNGLAADTTNGVLYSNDSARLYKWNYGSAPGTAPTAISGLYRRTAAGGGSPTGVDGLAFARGSLYGYSDFPSETLEDGIYRIDTSVVGSGSVPNMELVWGHPDKDYNFEGLDYDPTTGLFYATNTVSPLGPTTATGLYAIDLFAPTVTVTKIADFDASFLANPDGLAVGGGKLWLSAKPAGSKLYIESFDLTTRAFGDRLAFDIEGTDTGARSTGLTWAPGALNPVPEPASMLALGLGAAASIRRRKK